LLFLREKFPKKLTEYSFFYDMLRLCRCIGEEVTAAPGRVLHLYKEQSILTNDKAKQIWLNKWKLLTNILVNVGILSVAG
jgi:hypothetical protein